MNRDGRDGGRDAREAMANRKLQIRIAGLAEAYGLFNRDGREAIANRKLQIRIGGGVKLFNHLYHCQAFLRGCGDRHAAAKHIHYILNNILVVSG